MKQQKELRDIINNKYNCNTILLSISYEYVENGVHCGENVSIWMRQWDKSTDLFFKAFTELNNYFWDGIGEEKNDNFTYHITGNTEAVKKIKKSMIKHGKLTLLDLKVEWNRPVKEGMKVITLKGNLD